VVSCCRLSKLFHAGFDICTHSTAGDIRMYVEFMADGPRMGHRMRKEECIDKAEMKPLSD